MNRNVVVVDDQPDIGRNVAELLRGEGYVVCEAADGAGAFRLVLSERPWLLVVGESLTDITGRQLLERLAAEESVGKVYVLMLTRPSLNGGGMSEVSEAQRMIDMYLTKPYNPLELRSFVRRLRDHALDTQGNA